jgi:hypothetical protein
VDLLLQHRQIKYEFSRETAQTIASFLGPMTCV